MQGWFLGVGLQPQYFANSLTECQVPTPKAKTMPIPKDKGSKDSDSCLHGIIAVMFCSAGDGGEEGWMIGYPELPGCSCLGRVI